MLVAPPFLQMEKLRHGSPKEVARDHVTGVMEPGLSTGNTSPSTGLLTITIPTPATSTVVDEQSPPLPVPQ